MASPFPARVMGARNTVAFTSLWRYGVSVDSIPWGGQSLVGWELMKLRSLLGSLVFVAASILNPAYFAGCGASDDDYKYGAKDMVALLATANGSYEIEHQGKTYRVELAVDAEAEPEARASWW